MLEAPPTGSEVPSSVAPNLTPFAAGCRRHPSGACRARRIRQRRTRSQRRSTPTSHSSLPCRERPGPLSLARRRLRRRRTDRSLPTVPPVDRTCDQSWSRACRRPRARFSTTDPAGHPLRSSPASLRLRPQVRTPARQSWRWSSTTRGQGFSPTSSSRERLAGPWRPLIDGRDRGRIEALVWALPLSFMAADVLRPRSMAGRPMPGRARHRTRYCAATSGVSTDSLARRFVADGPIPAPVSPDSRRGARIRIRHEAGLAPFASPDGSVDAGSTTSGTLRSCLAHGTPP